MQIQQIKEICLYTDNLEATRVFYSETLGFSIISEVANRHIFFRVGEAVLLFFNPEMTREEKTLPPHYAVGPQHLAFQVDLCDYKDWKEKLQQKKVEIIHEQFWKEGLYSFYFRDPVGNVLEIVPPGIWE
ncbi:VOC family protein [Tunicatimonas pelagia]|uniref:VOC family protein n=1 Tax=Tunicatimonas pelagia TaxID=931531 RepID=UPI00266617B2|nr:VOC family protein [Tunicatimonas pelagia]WKN42846.1 VOC family protein [Tunicatimonas pelagia]